MKLGDYSQIIIGTSNLKESLDFYHKFAFGLVESGMESNPWAQISDESILLLVNEDGKKYIGLTYFNPNLEKLLPELEKLNVRIVERIEKEGKLYQVIFASPDDFLISIINYNADGMYQPHGLTLANFPESDYADPGKYPNRACGVFGELCQPVKDIQVSIDFWKSIGYRPLSVNKLPYPWAIMADDHNLIGLHQTSDFDTPAITYFAPDQGIRIERLKEKGLDSIELFTGTGGDVNNQVATSPEGQKIFLFSA